MPTILYSKSDPAGRNIADQLRKLYGFSPVEKIGGKFPAWKNAEGLLLAELEGETVTSEWIDDFFKTDLIVFASEHRSESGKPTLTAHPCGNWSDETPKFGGKPRTLAPTSAIALKAAMLEMTAQGGFGTPLSPSPPKPPAASLAGFEVVLECTHHGPLLQTPFIYVEIGSTENQWSIPEAGEIIAKACHAACKPQLPTQRIAIGVGGIHYPYEITKQMLKTDIAVGHIVPKYAFQFLDEEMLEQMLEKSGGKVELALIDWKSIKAPEREKAVGLLKAFNIPFQKA